MILKNVAMAFLAKGELTPESRGDLIRLGRLAGVPETEVSTLIESERSLASRLSAVITQLLQAGDCKANTEPQFRNATTESRTTSSSRPISNRQVNTIESAFTAGRFTSCHKCNAETLHLGRLDSELSVEAWCRILLRGATLPMMGRAISALTLAAAQCQHLTLTGRSLLPRFSCIKCDEKCSWFRSTGLFLATFWENTDKHELFSPERSGTTEELSPDDILLRDQFVKSSSQNIEYYSTFVAGIFAEPSRLAAVVGTFVGDIVELRRDPQNPYDKNAIRILLAKNSAELGFVPKGFAAEISPRMRLGFRCRGYVKKVDDDDEFPFIGVVLGLARPHLSDKDLNDQLQEWKVRYLVR